MTDGNRLGPPPVEPMSDVAWSRVERGLWARMDVDGPTVVTAAAPPARRWWLAVAPLAAAAAVLAIVLALRTTTKIGPTRVVTGDSPTQVMFDDDADLEVAAQTALVMDHESGHPLVLLERGAAWFTVAPRMQRPEFVVRAGNAMVRVVGTRFRVARSEERISVEVERGLVDVQFRGTVVAVGPGQRWSSESPGEVATIASRPTGSSASTAPVASNEPAPSAPATGAPPPPEPRHVAKPARPQPRADARPEPRSEVDADGDPEPDPGTAAAGGDDRERIEYERLAGLEATSPEVARTGYLALARGTSRWAGLALFAVARLAADRHDRSAETLLRSYLLRFPHGANAEDAKQLLARLKGERP